MVELKKQILTVGDAEDYGFKQGDWVNENVIQVVISELKRQGKAVPVYSNSEVFINGVKAKRVYKLREVFSGLAIDDEAISRLIKLEKELDEMEAALDAEEQEQEQ